MTIFQAQKGGPNSTNTRIWGLGTCKKRKLKQISKGMVGGISFKAEVTSIIVTPS